MSTTMKIQKGIPVPEQKGAGRPRIYKFEDMEISTEDSPVCVTIDAPYSRIYACLQRFLTMPEAEGMDFRISKYGEEKCRVWRLK